uniref:Uncharacterized protein n=1 Tax=Arundo donax TaxID=35708 RepID=A0A0A8YLH4_ARUDO
MISLLYDFSRLSEILNAVLICILIYSPINFQFGYFLYLIIAILMFHLFDIVLKSVTKVMCVDNKCVFFLVC